MATNYYFRTGGNDANAGTINDDAHAWALPLPGCVGGAFAASSGDTINCTQAGTFALGSSTAILPDGVNLAVLATTIITSTSSTLPAVTPGASCVFTNGSFRGKYGFGKIYIGANAVGGTGTDVGTVAFPALFTLNNVDIQGTTSAVIFEWFADEATDGISISTQLPTSKGIFNTCTLTSSASSGTLISGIQGILNYKDSEGTGNHLPWQSMSLKLTACTIIASYTGVTSDATRRVRACTNADIQIDMYGCNLIATDNISTSATSGDTSALNAGQYGKTIMIGGALTSNRTLDPTHAYDVQLTSVHNPTAGSAYLVGVAYNTSKVGQSTGATFTAINPGSAYLGTLAAGGIVRDPARPFG